MTEKNEIERGGLTSPVLSGKQASMWTFIDQVLVKYGPLGVMLCLVIYYIVVKDDVIERKDTLLLDQQRSMLEITKASTEALVRTSSAQMDLARSVDENTKTMSRLVVIMDRKN